MWWLQGKIPSMNEIRRNNKATEALGRLSPGIPIRTWCVEGLG